MNTQDYHILATFLGKSNLGPKQLTATDRDDIAIQVANDLLKRDPYAAIGERFELPVYQDDTDLVRFLAKTRNIEPYAIATQVLKEQKLSIANLFGEQNKENEVDGLPSPLTIPTGHYVSGNTPCVNPSKPEHVLREERIPLEKPQQLTVENCVYMYRGFIPYAAKNGEIIGGSVAYMNHEQYILLPLHICKHTLSSGYQQPCLRIGWRHSHFPLMNEDMMLSKPTLAVLFCLDSLIADKLLDFMNKEQLGDYIIPTCHCGGKKELGRANIEALRGHDIVILPASTVESYADAHYYANYLLTHGARSIKISIHSVLLFHKPNEIPDINQVSDPLLRHIITNAIDINEDSSQKIIYEITRKAIDVDKYYKWGYDVKLFKDIVSNENYSLAQQMLVLEECDQQNTIIYLDKIILPGMPVLIVGPSDGGKGMVGYTISIGLSFKKDVFHFSILNKKKVLYIDSESTHDEAKVKISRIANGLGIPVGTDIRQGIDHWSLLSEELNVLLDLGDKNGELKKKIEERILSSKSDVVVFDNLVAIAPGSYKSTKAFTELFAWLQGLSQNHNVSIVCMHHTNKEGGTLGIGEIEDKFRTVFILDDLEALKKEAKKDTTLYSKFLDQPGCLFRMRCKKSKSYPQLKQQRFGYFLRFNVKNPVQGENWICVEQPHFHAEDNGNMDIPRQSAASDDECGVTENLTGSQHHESSEVFSDAATAEIDELGTDSQGSIPCAHSLVITTTSASKKGKALDQNIDKILDFAQKHGVWFKRAEVEEHLKCKRQTALNALSAAKDQGLLDCQKSGSETQYRIRRK